MLINRAITFLSSFPVYLGRVGRRLVAGQLMAACAALNAANAADAALIEAAKKEGQVIWYTTFIVNQATRPLVEAFQAKYPEIEVKFARYNPDDIVLRFP